MRGLRLGEEVRSRIHHGISPGLSTQITIGHRTIMKPKSAARTATFLTVRAGKPAHLIRGADRYAGNPHLVQSQRVK